MTPQEKAQELFTTFRYALSHKDAPLGMHKDNIAKKCALVAVYELESQEAKLLGYDSDRYSSEYWQQVKQEIEKL